MYNQLRYH